MAQKMKKNYFWHDADIKDFPAPEIFPKTSSASDSISSLEDDWETIFKDFKDQEREEQLTQKAVISYLKKERLTNTLITFDILKISTKDFLIHFSQNFVSSSKELIKVRGIIADQYWFRKGYGKAGKYYDRFKLYELNKPKYDKIENEAVYETLKSCVELRIEDPSVSFKFDDDEDFYMHESAEKYFGYHTPINKKLEKNFIIDFEISREYLFARYCQYLRDISSEKALLAIPDLIAEPILMTCSPRSKQGDFYKLFQTTNYIFKAPATMSYYDDYGFIETLELAKYKDQLHEVHRHLIDAPNIKEFIEETVISYNDRTPILLSKSQALEFDKTGMPEYPFKNDYSYRLAFWKNKKWIHKIVNLEGMISRHKRLRDYIDE